MLESLRTSCAKMLAKREVWPLTFIDHGCSRLLLLALPSEAKFDVEFALDVTLIPGDVQAEQIRRADFFWVRRRAHWRRTLTAVGRWLDGVGVAAEAADSGCNLVEIAHEDAGPTAAFRN